MTKKNEKKAQLDDIDEVYEDDTFLHLYKVHDPWGRMRTGCLLHDLQAGGSKGILGYPLGWMVNFVGGSSSGKTLAAHELTGYEYNQDKKMKPCYIPTEYGDSFDTEKMYGFDATIDPEDIPKTVQEADAFMTQHVHSLADPNKKENVSKNVIILDSLDGLRSNQTIDMQDERVDQYRKGKEVKDKGSYQAQKACFLSQHFFPNQACNLRHKKASLIIISQVRDNMSVTSFETEKRNGGRAMDFYCHTVQWFYQVQKLYATGKAEKEGRAAGAIMRVKNKKSKTPRPGRIINILLYFNFGVDDVGTSLLFLYDLLTEKGRMTCKNYDIEWDGEETTFLDLRDRIYGECQNGNYANRKKLDQLVIEKWEDAEQNSIKFTPGGGSFSKY